MRDPEYPAARHIADLLSPRLSNTMRAELERLLMQTECSSTILDCMERNRLSDSAMITGIEIVVQCCPSYSSVASRVARLLDNCRWSDAVMLKLIEVCQVFGDTHTIAMVRYKPNVSNRVLSEVMRIIYAAHPEEKVRNYLKGKKGPGDGVLLEGNANMRPTQGQGLFARMKARL